ncbi:KDO2-lipid IV(A) lauroyltransferase [Kineococcus radiotolerans]|uniref:Lipid A biosynthesis acyltransferase n=2 Tax=Kineococcus radiotolerans TaxID=131568 RepID=A6WCI8_KINRD|nr:phosphatidylinositol mannoside acyltransferase [Kineococcus radiotolerans]ABS04527.1 lipid A biosynthesis acyltransferase [Kineococcus radiotolerans SRS30216 = ATCC BAA-149]MBB2902799.1 KDO2-lipid IV(A) lauroyltransferase [Kineococcus radiotolerans]
MSPVAGRARDALVTTAFRLGWRLARTVPEPLAARLCDRVADRVVAHGGERVEQLRRNLSRARPDALPAELDTLVRDGFRSYARYWFDAFALPGWSRERIVGTVRAEGEEELRAALATGGAVAFVGHLGNWDHAAAWSAFDLHPVVTVAERLRPEEVYQEFLAFRRSLGMEVLPLGDPATFPTLVRRLREGALVPLLADRDLASTGVEVDFLGERVRMAPGPAALALLTGAPLFPMTVHHEVGPRGRVLVVTTHPRVPVPEREAGESAREHRRRATAAMTQAGADALAGAVRAHPDEWHVLQPLFPADLGRS